MPSLLSVSQIDQQLRIAQGTYDLLGEEYQNLSSQMGGTPHGLRHQKHRIGTSEVIELLQRQHQVFIQIAAHVAETHELCDG
jgi:hypothetical protein